jgi:hypothetical protein
MVWEIERVENMVPSLRTVISTNLTKSECLLGKQYLPAAFWKTLAINSAGSKFKW